MTIGRDQSARRYRDDGDDLHERQQPPPAQWGRRRRRQARRPAGLDCLAGGRPGEDSYAWFMTGIAATGESIPALPLARTPGIIAPVRILIVSTAFPRYPDDPTAKWLVETIRRLAAEGYEFEVLTSAYRGGGNTAYAGIPVHRFRYFFARWERLTHEESAPDRMRRSLLYKSMALCYVGCGTVAAWRLGRRGRFDIVHVHWPVPHALFGWAARAGSADTAKIIAHFYSVELRWVRHSLRVLRGFLRRAMTSADRVVAISNSTAAEVRSVAPVPVEVIPYAVDLPVPSLTALPRAKAACAVLFVGRLAERKGVRYLIDAVAALPRELQPRLTIIGDGPERPALEAQTHALHAEDRVAFLGWVTPEQLDAAYAAASVSCCRPSSTRAVIPKGWAWCCSKR